MDSTWHGGVGDGAGTDPRPLAGVTLQPNRRDQPFSLLPSSRQQPWAAGKHPNCSPRSTEQVPTLPTYSTHSFGAVLAVLPVPPHPWSGICSNPILPSQHCPLPHFAFQCGPAPLPSHSHPHPGLRFSCC